MIVLPPKADIKSLALERFPKWLDKLSDLLDLDFPADRGRRPVTRHILRCKRKKRPLKANYTVKNIEVVREGRRHFRRASSRSRLEQAIPWHRHSEKYLVTDSGTNTWARSTMARRGNQRTSSILEIGGRYNITLQTSRTSHFEPRGDGSSDFFSIQGVGKYDKRIKSES